MSLGSLLKCMKCFFYAALLILLLSTFACNNSTEKPKLSAYDSFAQNLNATTNTVLHPLLSRKAFDTLHTWDLAYFVLEPIRIATSEESEITLLKQLSPGQKALYLFWDIDEQVDDGGFIQYYLNGYGPFMPDAIEGMSLIGDTSFVNLLNKAHASYLLHKAQFDIHKANNNWAPLFDSLKEFEKYDAQYYKIRDQSMKLVEIYIRQNANEFVILN
ncbi:MAG: hypothetical protein CFE21_12975 [Bacteroidetes bacterium B1(2017)]|nr:MAG: hypothetical protein CFE21_12975 [Bacteroidetes bacterium B1(2017)]